MGRAVAALRVRTTAFKKKTPRIHALRAHHISTQQLVRAMGPTSMTYAVDTIGMADGRVIVEEAAAYVKVRSRNDTENS